MADDRTPFERLFSPDQSGGGLATVFSDVGKVAGVPTANERFGQLEGQAVNDLAGLVQGGLTPQQAVLKYVQTPNGQKWFMSGDTNIAGTIQNFMTQTTAPLPQQTNVPEGSALISTPGAGQPNAGVPAVSINNPSKPTTNIVPAGAGLYATNQGGTTKVGAEAPIKAPGTVIKNGPGETSYVMQPDGNIIRVGSQPTNEVQNSQYFQGLANLDPVQLSRMATGKLVGDNVAALDRLVVEGTLPGTMRDKLIAGTLEVKETKDPYGKPNGEFVVVDKSNPNNPVITPLAPTGPQQDPRNLPKDQRAEDDKKNMFLGTGIGAKGIQIVGGILRQIDPRLDPQGLGEQVDRQRTAIQQVHTALSGMNDNASTLGISTAKIKYWTDLAPSFGLDEDPLNAVNKGMRLRSSLEDELQANKFIRQDRLAPEEAKAKAYDRQSAIERVLRTLPSTEDMQALYGQIKQGNQVLSPGKLLDYSKNVAKQGQNIDVTTPTGTTTPIPPSGPQTSPPPAAQTAPAPAPAATPSPASTPAPAANQVDPQRIIQALPGMTDEQVVKMWQTQQNRIPNAAIPALSARIQQIRAKRNGGQ